MSNDISVIPGGDSLMPVMTVEQAVQRRSMMVDFCKKVMVKDTDYGVIPGTEKKDKDGAPSNDNATLLKPGAEKLCTLFGLRPVFEDDKSIIDFEKGLFHFSYNCILLRNARREILENGMAVITGDVAGTGIGSCNSLERKYRRGGKACPICGALAIKKSKYPPKDRETGEVIRGALPGWYCHAKSGGCGAEFGHDDKEIVDQSQQYDPAESANLINTLQKMAQKRSIVSAVLVATNASEFFTQDYGEEDHQKANGAAKAPGEPPGNQRKQTPKFITAAEVTLIRQWIAHGKCDEARTAAAFGAAKLEEISFEKYNDVFQAVKAKDPKVMPASSAKPKTTGGAQMPASGAAPQQGGPKTPPPQRQPGDDDESIPY